MAEKKIGEKRGKKKAATKKVIKKAKKAPSKRKITKPAKKKLTKKTAGKVTKKIKARTKKIAKKVRVKTKAEVKEKKTTKKVKVKAKVRKKKVTEKFKGKAEVKREKKAEKRVAVKGKETPPKLEEKVRVKTKAEVKKKKTTKKVKVKAKVKAKDLFVPKKAVPRRAKKVVPAALPPPIKALPKEYGEDSVALMTVDPRKLFIYWEIKGDTLARFVGTINVRIYDVTHIDFDGKNANSYLDIPVHVRIGNWYIDVSPEREYIVDIGIFDPSGVFITVARSNKVSTPRIEIKEVEALAEKEALGEEGALPHGLYETDLPVGY